MDLKHCYVCRAMEKGSRDNITVVVLDLDAYVMSCRESAVGGSDDINYQTLPADGSLVDDRLRLGGTSYEEPFTGPDMVTVASLLM